MTEVKVEVAPKAKKTVAATKTGVEAKASVKKAPAAKAEAKPKVASAKATATKKPAATRTAAKSKSSKVSPEQRYLMICEAAYYKAERRGFSPENEIQDWLDAESEINRLLGL
jgi:hypothetical protein